MVALMERDHKIFDFIEQFISEYGFSPTIREIATGTSLNFAPIEAGLRRLRQVGFLNYYGGKPRTIVIPRYSLTEKGEKAIKGGI